MRKIEKFTEKNEYYKYKYYKYKYKNMMCGGFPEVVKTTEQPHSSNNDLSTDPEWINFIDDFFKNHNIHDICVNMSGSDQPLNKTHQDTVPVLPPPTNTICNFKLSPDEFSVKFWKDFDGKITKLEAQKRKYDKYKQNKATINNLITQIMKNPAQKNELLEQLKQLKQ
jgi:hypothetical protein